MKQIERYGDFFSSLNEHFRDEEFRDYFADDAYFKDPFQEVSGVEKIISIFRHMYSTLDNPRFEIRHTLGDEVHGYIQWTFRYNDTSFMGVSYVVFDARGKVTSHVDYWDAASNIYEKLPLIGSIIRWIKHRIKASS